MFLATAAWRVLTFSGFQNDHYVHLARAQQVLLGDLPVRDFVDPGMPLMYLASAAVWRIWGGVPGTELMLVACAFAAGAACTVVVVHRLTGSIPLAVAAAVLEVLIAPRTYSYPKVLLYAAAACAIVALVESPSRRRIVIAAAIAAIAFLFRHDHGVYIGIAALAAVLLASRGGGSRALISRALLFAAASTLFVLPWLGFVEHHQGLGDYVASGLAFSRAESARNRGPLTLPGFTLTPSALLALEPAERPTARIRWVEGTADDARLRLEVQYGLRPVGARTHPAQDYHGRYLSPDDVRALAGDPHVEDAQGLDRFTEWSWRDTLLARLSPSRLRVGTGWHPTENAYVWLLYVFHLLPFACAAVAWRRARAGAERFPHESAAIGALAVLALLVNAGLLRGNLAVWLPDGVVPAAVLGAWLASAAWRGKMRVLVAVVAALTAAAVVRAGDLDAQLDRADLRSGVMTRAARLNARLWLPHRDAGNTPSGVSDALAPFFEYVGRCTTTDDRLLMTQLYPDVFVLAERGFAGGHVAFLEGFYTSPADQQRTLARLRGEPVPFILFIRSREDLFRDNFDLLRPYVDDHYRLMTELPLEETDAVRVFVDARRAVRRTDAATGWPCFR
jgi:hypothetical protein